ncbi:uncharacterized protein LOC121858137 [Homarus americanus]|uniref:uncharacterized protein LOC121858137 n=1 Tax=Homarus americanus TaxID=6706 RepID=UPI001C4506AB|nr:uncharacterized protein LOC121858137 [Homarus americanus]
MVVTSLVLLVAAGVCVGVVLLPTPDGKQSTSSSVLGVVKEVLATLAYSKFSVFFLTDGSTSASTIFKLEEELPIPGGVGVFEVVVEGQYIDNINTQLSHVICVIKQLRQMSSHTTIVLISDDPAFLAAFAEWSLKSRLLVWSTRLLAVTHLPLEKLHHLQRAFSKINAVLAIINDDSTNHRNILIDFYEQCVGKISVLMKPMRYYGERPASLADATSVHVTPTYSAMNASVACTCTCPTTQCDQAFQVGLLDAPPALFSSLTSALPEKFSKFPHRPSLLAASEVNPFYRIITVQDPGVPGGQKFEFRVPVPNLMDYLAKSS